MQVNIKPNYRSKGVDVNIPTKKQNVALSPFPIVTQNIGTSPVKLSVLKRKLFTENRILFLYHLIFLRALLIMNQVNNLSRAKF